VRAVIIWSIAPAQTIADHMDDPRNDLAVITVRYAVGNRK